MSNTCRILCRRNFASAPSCPPLPFLLLLFASSFCLLAASALLPKESSSSQKQMVGMITTGGAREAAAIGSNESDGEMGEEGSLGEGRKCEIKVHIVKQVRGECVRLFGGKPACQSAEYVDPENDQCRDEESIFL